MKTVFPLFIVILLLTFSSCSQNEEEPWVAKTIVLDEKSAQLIEAENEFGLELFQKVYASETKSDNIMVSPLSISLALAMTYNGANGETKSAMEKTLNLYGLTPQDINQSYQSLVAALKSLDPKVVLEIANAIFYRQDFQVENDFISTNQHYYDAKIDAIDFGSPNAVKTINNWVADKTHDKIDKIIENISDDQVMFLLNAIYFNGIWQNKFDEDDTQNLPFYLNSKGISNDVPTMQKTDAVPYISNELFSAVQLAYGSGNYSMFVLLPHESKSLEDIVNKLDQTNWENWMSSFNDTTNVDIKLPQLEYEYEIKLNSVLSDMGMSIAFDNGADFTGINKAGRLKIDEVKHKTFIKVNEKGTEAAAVTAVSIGVTSVGPVQNIQFNVNHPFFYAITEKDTDAILFMGTVKNPKNEQ